LLPVLLDAAAAPVEELTQELDCCPLDAAREHGGIFKLTFLNARKFLCYYEMSEHVAII